MTRQGYKSKNAMIALGYGTIVLYKYKEKFVILQAIGII